MGMTLLINNLSLKAGTFLLDNITLEVSNGEYFVLMGATGSGKSLLLKAICGLISIKSGNIIIGNRDITKLPPWKRELGYVPQNSNLFPNMDVISNIRFPQEVRGIASGVVDKKIFEIADMLKIKHLLDRSTTHLSGGERQKVALARALISQPQLLILDEPVSAVDEPTRLEICRDLTMIQKELGTTTIHVCHSVEEAKSVAERSAILANGVLMKIGTVDEISKIYYDKTLNKDLV
jgi:molybdate/tungstate transport system ATP-binding protein